MDISQLNHIMAKRGIMGQNNIKLHFNLNNKRNEQCIAKLI